MKWLTLVAAKAERPVARLMVALVLLLDIVVLLVAEPQCAKVLRDVLAPQAVALKPSGL